MRDGKWVCIDRIAHNLPPPAVMSPSEKQRFHEQYPA
jgi:hypothetical protein